MKSPQTLREVVFPRLCAICPFSWAPSRFQPGSSPVHGSGGKRRKQVVCFCGGRSFPTIVLGHTLVSAIALVRHVSQGEQFQLALSLMNCGDDLVAKLCPTLVTPRTVARQAPLSMGFPRQEYWSGLPFLSPGDLPHPGIEPRSPALQAEF